MQSLKRIRSLFKSTILLAGVITTPLYAQKFSLEDLSAFKKPSDNWKIVGGVEGSLSQSLNLSGSHGKGILANLPLQKGDANKDIYTSAEFGDADIEFEFMMAKGSNSGIYIQGRYEIQLLDSWGVQLPAAGDCGGIYERWDDSKPAGQKGYQGYAPRLNASKAPGLWQHMKISFQAPRFDAKGNKTENARIRQIVLNGSVIHENVELTGPTRAGLGPKEVARGPIRIQGDHGPIAFRNFEVTNYDAPKPTFTELKYAVAKQDIRNEADLANVSFEETGKAADINRTYSPYSNGYLLKFEGKLKVSQAGKYRLSGIFHEGYGRVKLNNSTVIPWSWWEKGGEIELPTGESTFELLYARPASGSYQSLGLFIEGPGIRRTALHNIKSQTPPSHPSNPILIPEVTETTIHRSFINHGKERISHGASVGTTQRVHYAVDLETGSVIRAWRGEFLNATPMWDSRGNGVSFPLGNAVDLTNGNIIKTVEGKNADNYRFKGYVLDKQRRPTFNYEFNGQSFNDQIIPDTESKYLVRTITSNGGTPFEAFLAQGKEITTVTDGLYMVDGQYYIRINEGGKGIITTDTNGAKQLVASTNSQLSYSIIW